jgi:hypothetical protein
MELRHITEDQLVHNRVIISQFSQKLQQKSYRVILFGGFSCCTMDGDEGASEELARQLFSVR